MLDWIQSRTTEELYALRWSYLKMFKYTKPVPEALREVQEEIARRPRPDFRERVVRV